MDPTRNAHSWEIVRSSLVLLGVAVSAAALVWTATGVRDQHEWNRRHYAIEMLREWNTETFKHKAALEGAYPKLYEDPGARLTDEEAHALYFATAKRDSKLWDLRNHAIALLNHFEYVASAYDNSVADPTIIDESHRPTMVRWYHQLEPLVVVVTGAREGKNPWAPLHRVIVDRWESKGEKKEVRKRTGGR